MEFSIMIGFDVTRTFLTPPGKQRKNVYQALRDGDLGPFDGKNLTVENVTMQTIPIQNLEDVSMVLILGRRIRKTELAHSGPLPDALTSWIPWEEYDRIQRDSAIAFRKLGIARDPVVHAYFPSPEVEWSEPDENEVDFYTPETVKLLRMNVDLILEHRRDPFVPMPYRERDDLHLLSEEEVERIKGSDEYRYVMEEMGEKEGEVGE